MINLTAGILIAIIAVLVCGLLIGMGAASNENPHDFKIGDELDLYD